MRMYSLNTVIFAIFIILVAVNFTYIYFYINQRGKEQLETAIQEKTYLAENINKIFFTPLLAYREAELPGFKKLFIGGTAGFEDVRYVRIVRLGGRINQSSVEEEEGVDKTIDDPDIEKAITTKTVIVKDEIFKGEKIKTIIYPGYQDNTIWVGFSLKRIEETINDILIHDIAVALGGLIFTFMIIFIILRIIINPLRKMTLACEEVRRGNLDVEIPIVSKTEIGALIATFNEMIKDLRESQTALKEAKGVLEIKVAARTRELKGLAEGLEEEVERRTKEVYERMEELEKFQRLAVGRELKMVALKEEIKKLEKNQGKKKFRTKI